MSRTLILGADPGLKGAIAIIDPNTMDPLLIEDVPLYKRWPKDKGRIDVHQLAFMIDAYAKFIALAVIEEPQAMPKQGVASTFRFGHSCGLIHGVLAANHLTVVPTRPNVWKPAMGLSHDKSDSLNKARKLFPSIPHRIKFKKHHDRAEALLLAVFGMKHLSKFLELSE